MTEICLKCHVIIWIIAHFCNEFLINKLISRWQQLQRCRLNEFSHCYKWFLLSLSTKETVNWFHHHCDVNYGVRTPGLHPHISPVSQANKVNKVGNALEGNALGNAQEGKNEWKCPGGVLEPLITRRITLNQEKYHNHLFPPHKEMLL